jgi:DNA-binding IclR family transcriptional regulator
VTHSQLARGLRVLELLSSGPARSTEIADALGVHRSTAMRLLNELVELGYVTRPNGGYHYEVAIERLAWVVPALERSDFVSSFRPLLEELNATSGEATVLALPVGSEMVYVDYLPARSAIGVRERIGTHRPIHASAVGQAWLSGLDRDELAQVITGLPLIGGTARAVRTREALEDRIVETRERGWALDLQETIEGGTCVAVPVWFRGRLVGAVAVSAPAERLDEARLDEYGRYMLEVREAPHMVGIGSVAIGR